MNSEKYYKNMFIGGAIYNIGAGLPLLIISFFTDSVYSIFGLDKPNYLLWIHFSFLCIIVFGIGYYMVSRNPESNQGIVLIGGIAKMCFFLLTTIAYLNEEANFLLLFTGIIDFIFVILFFEFLLKQRKKE